jgi:hypothetical protein
MNRRPLGRGRLLAILFSITMLVGCLLPWYTYPGADLPTGPLNAFSGSGFLVFLAALAVLALVSLPYAAGDRPVAADRALIYLLLALAAWVGVLVWPLGLLGDLAGGLLPDHAPGFWVAIVGTAGLTRAGYEMAHEPGRR